MKANELFISLDREIFWGALNKILEDEAKFVFLFWLTAVEEFNVFTGAVEGLFTCNNPALGVLK